jgi:hypothetical protein
MIKAKKSKENYEENLKNETQNYRNSCKVCFKTFKEKGNLKIHERIHVIMLFNIDGRETFYLQFHGLLKEF